jgi:hypothetical protein
MRRSIDGVLTTHTNDCGFGTFVGFGQVLPDVAWTKLGNLVASARIASARL